MRLLKLFFLLASITIFLEMSVKAQAILTFETAIRPNASGNVNSEGNTIQSDAFQIPSGLVFNKEEDYEFVFSLDALQDYKISSHYLTQLDEYKLKIQSNYNFMSEIPEYGAMLEISNNF